jgi:formamidopyrimidine-DNA glycosylase
MAPSSAGRCTRGRSAIPELPEVETVRRELEPWLTGRTVEAAELEEAVPGPKYAHLARAVGGRIRAVGRHGKFLLLPLERPAGVGEGAPDDVLVIHLGMTGVISATRPTSHLRVRVTFDGPEPRTLYFRDVRRFGRVTLAPGGVFDTLPTLRDAGPDALAADFTVDGFARALARSTVAVKTALMSQRPVAGVGNIYADEALWRVRLHPLRPAQSLRRGDVAALHAAIGAVLRESLEVQGTTLYDYRTVNGDVGAFIERLAVYGQPGAPCPRCGTTIERIVVGARGTHVCPSCQVRPRVREAPRVARGRR